jgi:hypothetical protein
VKDLYSYEMANAERRYYNYYRKNKQVKDLRLKLTLQAQKEERKA